MYGWIWRHLPFGLPGKLIGSIGLVVASAALLWYVVFPWAEPLLPFDDVQVTQQDSTGGASVEPTPSGGDDEIPYATHSNNPAPTATR